MPARLTVLALLLALAAPAARADALDVGLLVAAESSLAVDMLQTLDIKRHPGHFETNPILGRHPSDPAVIGYFAACGAATYLAWRELPRPWRLLLPLAVIAVQVPQVSRNARAGIVVRF